MPGTARQGPIPYDRHQAILTKQRDEAAAERTAFLAKYHGLDRMSPEQWGAVSGLMTELSRDPLTVIGRLLDELGQNPATARQVQSWIGQRFPVPAAGPAAAPAAAADPDPMPQPDAEGGYTHTGLAQLLAWQTRRTLAEAAKANAPLHEELERVRTERSTRDAETRATQYASTLLAEVGKLPGFQEHQAAIREKFLGLRFPKGAPEGDITAALYRCYVEVVMPTYAQSARQTVLDTLDTKAKAQTTSPTGRTTAAPTTKPLSFREALAAEFRSS